MRVNYPLPTGRPVIAGDTVELQMIFETMTLMIQVVFVDEAPEYLSN